MKPKVNLVKRQEYWEIIRSSSESTDPDSRFSGDGSCAEQGASPVLYLNSNISDNTPQNDLENRLNSLSSYHQKSAFVLSDNVRRFCDRYGLERCGFLTLTFPDNVQDHKEASRRFNNLNRRFLSRFYGEWVWTRERQKRGAWHYHIIIQCPGDIRTGFDFSEFDSWIEDRAKGKRRRLRTGGRLIRSLWDVNNRVFSRYGFGRCELLPIRSTADVVASYVGKYISKQIGQRSDEDKGVRLTGNSQGFTASSPKFSWNTEGAREWRRKLKLFAQYTCKCGTYEDFCSAAGPRWAYRYKNLIMDQKRHIAENYEEAPF